MAENTTDLPLRTQEDRLRFCDDYFSAVGAPISFSSASYREYSLPNDVDKEMTDRPYYWMWIEKTGQTVPPSTLRLGFSEEAVRRENERLRAEALRGAQERNASELELRFLRSPTAEFVTLGSFRLAKIYDSLDRRGRFASVKIDNGSDSPLVPWLMVNILVSLRCDLVEQEYLSFGICLLNGQIVDSFYPKLARLKLSAIPAAELMVRSATNPADAIRHVRRFAEQQMSRKPTDWAQAASERLRNEVKQLNTYYDSVILGLSDQDKDVAEKERARKIVELHERSEPRIEMTIKQLALIGMPER